MNTPYDSNALSEGLLKCMPSASTTPSSKPPASAPAHAAEAAERDDDQRRDGVGLAHRRARSCRPSTAGSPRRPTGPGRSPNISGCSRWVSMPTSCAPIGDCISARTPLPSSVMRSSTISATRQHQRQAEHQQLVGRRTAPAQLHRLGQIVVAAQVAAPHPGAPSSAPGTSGRSPPSGRAPRRCPGWVTWRVRRRKHSQWMTSPSAISTTNDTGTISSGDRPSVVCAIQVR